MQKKKLLYSLVAFLLGVCTVLVYTTLLKEEARSRSLDALTFENTQQWEPFFLTEAQRAQSTHTITLPPPPRNTSRTTKKDLDVLHDAVSRRTPEKIEEIRREVTLEDAYFGEETLLELVHEDKRPHTFALMKYVGKTELPYIFVHKLSFNRVRPSELDQTLKTVIDVPNHPSYPSGHATQAHLRAHVLTLLNPKAETVYKESAERIAHNREIAGVHYPSDSKAGAELSNTILNHLQDDPTFITLLTKAQEEWE